MFYYQYLRKKSAIANVWQCPSNLLSCPAAPSFWIPVSYSSDTKKSLCSYFVFPLALPSHLCIFLQNCSHCPRLFFFWKCSMSRTFWHGDRYASALPLQLPLFITQVLAAVSLQLSATATLSKKILLQWICWKEETDGRVDSQHKCCNSDLLCFTY